MLSCRTLLFLSALLALAACASPMADQPRCDTYEATNFFSDGSCARPLPANAVPRSAVMYDAITRSGLDANQEYVTGFPLELSDALLQRGRERYDIYCTPCHGLSGYGDGMIVQRGFPAPPSLHSDRLREAPNGYYFDVITNGFGIMYDYAARVEVADRWAIVAYIRALQLSQNVSEDQLTTEEREQLAP